MKLASARFFLFFQRFNIREGLRRVSSRWQAGYTNIRNPA